MRSFFPLKCGPRHFPSQTRSFEVQRLDILVIRGILEKNNILLKFDIIIKMTSLEMYYMCNLSDVFKLNKRKHLAALIVSCVIYSCNINFVLDLSLLHAINKTHSLQFSFIL